MGDHEGQDETGGPMSESVTVSGAGDQRLRNASSRNDLPMSTVERLQINRARQYRFDR